MTNRSKLAAIAMLMMAGVATPAFAGSLNDDQTTAAKLDEASYQRNDDQTTAAKLDEVSLRQVSPNGFTAAPLLVADNSPAATGGGSDGYNNSTAHDYILADNSPAATGGGSDGYNNSTAHDYI